MFLPSVATVDLSRIQFGFTAIFHFLFVPLTLGLSWMLVVMEGCYLATGKVVYKDMTRFWGKLLAINFAMGVVTGVTMEFEFGTNWAYFAKFAGDTFGTVLAVEGITAFMLEATLLGLFLFGWNKINKHAHFLVTFFLAVGSNLSVVNILVANSWMQHPAYTTIDYQSMHVGLISLFRVYTDTLAQIRVSHVMLAGTMTGTMFVMGISAFYLLRGRDLAFAKRSMGLAIGFGIIACLCVGFFGDANGLAVSKYEPQKMAAIEGIWDEPTPPAAWTVIAFPSQKNQTNYFPIQIPYGLSIIATHSLNGTVPGAKQVMENDKPRILSGLVAFNALKKIRAGTADAHTITTFNMHKKDLGYGLLLKRYDPTMAKPTPAQVEKAVKDTIPEVWVTFWSFRIMVLCWILMLLLILWGIYYLCRNTLHKHRGWLWLTLWAIPLPWIASEFGWVTAELGRQPWIIHGILPTSLGISTINTPTIAFSLGGFVVLYAILFCIELFLMFKYARLGPSSLGEKRYFFEDSKDVLSGTQLKSAK